MSHNMLYQKITDELQRKIDTGELKPGDKIPTVNELRQQYEVSHITILRAFKELQSCGFISPQGKRCIVNSQENHRIKRNRNCIGLLVRPLWPYNKKDIYFNEINYGIQDECCINGINYLTPASVRQLNQQIIEPVHVFADIERSAAAITDQVDGFLIDSRLPDTFVFKLMKDYGKPCVIVDRLTTLPVDSITPPNREAVRILCSTALRYGYQEFIFVESGAKISNMLCRKDAFEEFMASNGITPDHYRFVEDWTVKQADETFRVLEQAARELSSKGKFAVISSSDEYARAADQYLRASGFIPHKDFGTAGIDGMLLTQDHPCLTTVKSDAVEIGRLAVRAFLQRMASKGAPAKNYSPQPIFEYGETL